MVYININISRSVFEALVLKTQPLRSREGSSVWASEMVPITWAFVVPVTFSHWPELSPREKRLWI